jgi:hypothetical protein
MTDPRCTCRGGDFAMDIEGCPVHDDTMPDRRPMMSRKKTLNELILEYAIEGAAIGIMAAVFFCSLYFLWTGYEQHQVERERLSRQTEVSPR